MLFEVRVFDAVSAAIREETIEADTREAVERRLSDAGLIVLSALARRDFPASLLSRVHISTGRKGLDVAWWCRELRTLLTAGMTVVEALETLDAQALDQKSGHARSRAHAGLVVQLREGHALSTAMQTVGGFPSVLVAGVKASERTSSLVEALDDYLLYHDMLERLRKQIVSAAIYPAVVVTLGAAITLFLMLFVIPRFSGMYADLRGPVSWTTQALVGASQVINDHGSLVVIALTLLAVAILSAWRSGFVTRAAQQAAEAIGPLQRQIDEFRLAKLYHSMALMFRGGYALGDALRQCAGLGLGARLRGGIEAAEQGLAQGQRVSTAFCEAGLTDAVTQRLLAVGERTGNFDRILQTIAERHASNFATFVERATRVVEPLLLLLVALVVGGIVVMMYMPVFDIASSIH